MHRLVPRLHCLATIMLAVCVGGCANTRTTTNVDSSYAGKPTRIFVITKISPLATDVQDDFEALLAQDVRACGGTIAFHRVPAEAANPLALTTASSGDSRLIQAELVKFAPEAILNLITVHTYLNGAGLNGVTINGKFWDVKLNKNVWASESKMSFAPISTASTRAKSLYDNLAPQLRHAGMLPTCAASPATSQTSK